MIINSVDNKDLVDWFTASQIRQRRGRTSSLIISPITRNARPPLHKLRRAKKELIGKFVQRRTVSVETLSMTSREVRIDYLADHSELVGDLARISWTEWRSIYEQRGETRKKSRK
jgi:hypothetical protein